MFLLRFLFRLLSFAARVVGSFVLVLVLQIQWDGKTAEQYFVQFGKNFFVTKFLNQVSRKNAEAARTLASKKPPKALSSLWDHPALQKAKARFAVPPEMLPEYKRRIQELRDGTRRDRTGQDGTRRDEARQDEIKRDEAPPRGARQGEGALPGGFFPDIPPEGS